MKTLFLALAVMVTSFVLGQPADEQAVRKIMADFSSALKANNADALNSLLSEDYTFVNPQGVLLSKTERIQSMNQGQVVFESFSYEDIKVRIYGNVAVVNAKVNVKLKGQDPMVVRSTNTWVKNSGRWQLVASQGTSVTQ